VKHLDLLLNISVNILLFILVATSRFSPEHVYLFFLGVALNALPVLLGRFTSNPLIRENLSIAGTYGGGNRGVFLVSFFLPDRLLEFMIIDLGNYFSLLFIFPLAFRKKSLERKNHYLMAMAFVAVICGLIVNINNLPCYGCAAIKTVILYAIMLYTLYQIFQWLRTNWKNIFIEREMAWFIGARIGIIGSLFLIFHLVTLSWATTLLVFIILPTSSLLFVFFNSRDAIYDRVVKNTVFSMLVYFSAVIILALVKSFS
jgi:hypothetical protein